MPATPTYVWQRPLWPEWRWEAGQLLRPLAEARKAQGALLGKVAGLGLSLDRELLAGILTTDAVETAAIEGELLSRESVRSSVARRLGLPTAGLPPADRSVDGLVAMLLDATTGVERPLTAERLQGWQAALFPTGFSGLERIAVGAFRSGPEPMQVVSGPIDRRKVHYEAPPAERVAELMRGFLDWWSAGPGSGDGVIRAGIAHLRFVSIHPFEDGNGRIGRALADMALAQDERGARRLYSVSAQISAERRTYYELLERAQRGTGDATEWLAWFLERVRLAASSSELLVRTVEEKVSFWARHEAVALTERQRKVVNRLLDAGQDGFEGGLTTRKYAGIAHTSPATAQRELADLVEKGLLRRRPGGGRSTSYELAHGEAVR